MTLTLASPDVVILAENHAGLGEAGSADLAEMHLAAGALEAASVPVAVHGVQKKAVTDLTTTSRTLLAGTGGCCRC